MRRWYDNQKVIMKKHGLMLIGAGLLTIGLVSFKSANKTTLTTAFQVSWGKVGESIIEPTDNGVSTVTAVAGKPLKAIKIKVLRGGVNLHRCEIWFNNGSKKSIELRNDVSAGNESREINLTDNNEQVSKVVFWYDTRNYGNQKASVELWGKKIDS
jgi:hypothetical protein